MVISWSKIDAMHRAAFTKAGNQMTKKLDGSYHSLGAEKKVKKINQV